MLIAARYILHTISVGCDTIVLINFIAGMREYDVVVRSRHSRRSGRTETSRQVILIEITIWEVRQLKQEVLLEIILLLTSLFSFKYVWLTWKIVSYMPDYVTASTTVLLTT